MCTREKPQGTETLPPDIIDVSTDLFPRRLWGVPEEVMLCFGMLLVKMMQHYTPLMVHLEF